MQHKWPESKSNICYLVNFLLRLILGTLLIWVLVQWLSTKDFQLAYSFDPSWDQDHEFSFYCTCLYCIALKSNILIMGEVENQQEKKKCKGLWAKSRILFRYSISTISVLVTTVLKIPCPFKNRLNTWKSKVDRAYLKQVVYKRCGGMVLETGL